MLPLLNMVVCLLPLLLYVTIPLLSSYFCYHFYVWFALNWTRQNTTNFYYMHHINQHRYFFTRSWTFTGSRGYDFRNLRSEQKHSEHLTLIPAERIYFSRWVFFEGMDRYWISQRWVRKWKLPCERLREYNSFGLCSVAACSCFSLRHRHIVNLKAWNWFGMIISEPGRERKRKIIILPEMKTLTHQLLPEFWLFFSLFTIFFFSKGGRWKAEKSENNN